MEKKISAETTTIPVSARGKCSHCKRNDAQEEHTCPYQSEINDDNESLCDCCDECTDNCLMDI